MDIIKMVRDTRRIMQILHCAFAVMSGLHINHMHRSTRCAVMYAGT